MAKSLNQVQLIGNVGQDPDIKSLQNGDKVANLSIATSESWKDKATGEIKENTQWHRVVVWNQSLIGVIEKYVAKGDKIYVSGALETRSWEQDGVKKYTTEVVLKAFNGNLLLLGGSKSGGGGEATASENRPAPIAEDEIPFAFVVSICAAAMALLQMGVVA